MLIIIVLIIIRNKYAIGSTTIKIFNENIIHFLLVGHTRQFLNNNNKVIVFKKQKHVKLFPCWKFC